MTYKLNSFKVFKDNWPTFVLGMIVALFSMLAIGCRWNFIEKAESETETAWTAEVREPWKLIEDDLWLHQEMPPIAEKETEHERFKEMAAAYNLDASDIWHVENFYWIREWVVLCITVAETSWWKRWAWWSNIWSVWSNDRWDRPKYALMEAWLEAIGRTLANQNLWRIQTLWCLSNWWSCQSWDDHWYRYATSDWSWERNMVACLSKIYGRIDAKTFSVRR